MLINTAARDMQPSLPEELLTRLRQPFVISDGVPIQLEVFAGLVEFSNTHSDVEDLLRKATIALHQAQMRDTPAVWYSSDFDLPHRRAYGLLRAIPKSLAEGEFRLVFQPKIELSTARISGLEALARWRHPRLGDIPPGEFVKLLETTTLIHDFTDWVLHTACEQVAIWKSQGILLTVAVNISSKNLEHPLFLKNLRNAIELHGIDPSSLSVECTEYTVMTTDLAEATLAAVRAMGVGVSLDDFGVGYSNLSCLHSLPVQMLKLDRSLIAPIATDARAFTLVKSLIDMGHALGLRMLGEGVETAEVLDLLKHHGCDAAQGYYIARPLEADAIPAFFQASRGPYFPNMAEAALS
ncbi:hypothetical protein Acidovoranil_14450 [Acidovorax sp. FG27]